MRYRLGSAKSGSKQVESLDYCQMGSDTNNVCSSSDGEPESVCAGLSLVSIFPVSFDHQEYLTNPNESVTGLSIHSVVLDVRRYES